MDIKTGFNHSILKTKDKFLFIGSNQNEQFPYELGNNYSMKFSSGKIIKLNELEINY